MKKLIKPIIFIAIMAILNSCVITQEFDFESDFSGNFAYTIELAQMDAYMGNEDSTDYFASLNKDSIIQAYSAVKGISNVQVTTTTTSYTVRYSFKDLESLSQSLKLEDRGIVDEQYKYKKRKFTYENKGFESQSAQNDSLMEMYEYINIISKYHFKQVIKESNKGEVSADGHGLYMEQNMKELIKPNQLTNLEVLFKK
jgi:hypothetical protein